MNIKTFLVLCLMMSISLCFATNCAKFNPQNFKICLACVQKYYISQGNCVACTDATINKSQCVAKVVSNEKKQETNQLQSINQNKPEQATANSSQNSLNKKTSNSENVPPKQSQTTVSNTQTSKIQSSVIASTVNTLPNPTSTENTNQVNKTPVNNAPLSLKDLLLAQKGLNNCCQFAITADGIKCTACQNKFKLNQYSQCVPQTTITVSETIKPTQKANPETIKATDNSPKPSNSIQDPTTSSTSGSVNSGVVDNIPERTPSVNDAKPASLIDKTAASPSSQVATTFIPLIPNTDQPTIQSQPKTSQAQPSQTPISISTSLFYSTANSDSTKNSITLESANPNGNTNNKVDNMAVNSAKTTTITPEQDIIHTPLPAPIQVTPPTPSTTLPTIAVNNPQVTVKFPIPNKPKDNNCAKLNLRYSQKQPISRQNRRCQICYKGFYYNTPEQICKPNNPNCKGIDDQNNCLDCYPGYSHSNGDCVISQFQPQLSLLVTSSSPNSNGVQRFNSASAYKQPDSNCREYIRNTNICIMCAANFYLSNGICVRVDPLCRTFNPSNGNCLGCFLGYYLNTLTEPHSCSLSPTSNCINLKNCSCPQGSYLSNGICLQVSPLCKTYNRSNGQCLSCYTGYALITGICKMIQQIVDPFCYVYGASGCSECIDSYYTDPTGVCQPVNGLCYGYNKKTGECTGCLPLYTLQNGNCVFIYPTY